MQQFLHSDYVVLLAYADYVPVHRFVISSFYSLPSSFVRDMTALSKTLSGTTMHRLHV